MRSLIALTLLGWGALAPAGRDRQPAQLSATVSSGSDSLERARAIHALNRLAFGPRPGDVDRVLAIGVDRWIERQLRPENISDERLDGRLQDYDVLALSSEELAQMFAREREERRRRQQAQTSDSARARGTDQDMTARPRRDVENEFRRATAQFQQLAVTRAVLSERQLQEVMVDFWTNHFNVFRAKGALRYLTPEYIEKVIRPNAFGRFEDLLVATAQSPAMMVYLDNAQSVAPGSAPPQLTQMERRLAQARRARPRRREAGRLRQMEQRLTRMRDRLPKGLNENYARELLELHTVGVDGGYTQEDVINVARILTGWSVGPTGRRPTEFAFNAWAHDTEPKTVMGREFVPHGGPEEGVELLRMLASHPSTMRHVSSKLCTKFVNDQPPMDCVDAGVSAWQESNGSIREVVRAIVTSQSFWAMEHRTSKTKSPLEFVVSAVRALGGQPDSTPRLQRIVARLGQPLYLHQPPDGYPETQESWVNAGALLNRLNIALAMSAGRIPGITHDADQIASLEGDLDAMVASVNASILSGTASANTLRVMREQAEVAGNPRRARVILIAYALGSPEFQRQ